MIGWRIHRVPKFGPEVRCQQVSIRKSRQYFTFKGAFNAHYIVQYRRLQNIKTRINENIEIFFGETRDARACQ